MILLALSAIHLVFAVFEGGRDRGQLRIAAGRPHEMADIFGRCAVPRHGVEPRPLIARACARVGQEHDRRLQAFGAVHRHDADLVALLLHVALDLDVAGAKLIEEALQRGRGIAVEGERAVEKLIDRLGGLRP